MKRMLIFLLMVVGMSAASVFGAPVVADATTAQLSFGQWIAENFGAVVAIVVATLGVAAMICKLTPSPKDDAIVAKILKWINMVPTKK